MSLIIEDLYAGIEGKTIIKGLNLTLDKGEVHAIMGPNGSGKSTLSYVLTGRENYHISSGKITLDGVDITTLEPHERAHLGLFLAFQYPVEIPGVTASIFLRHMVNAQRKAHNQEEYDPMSFVKIMRAKAEEVGIPIDMLKRSVNTGYSGGEKKRFEALQMSLLEPKCAILDETDSGLDIDAMKAVAHTINSCKKSETNLLVITHYQRLLNYIKPDKVHILFDGAIVKTGTSSLVEQLEQEGYAPFIA